jgi:hypothetical protein
LLVGGHQNTVDGQDNFLRPSPASGFPCSVDDVQRKSRRVYKSKLCATLLSTVAYFPRYIQFVVEADLLICHVVGHPLWVPKMGKRENGKRGRGKRKVVLPV